MNYQEAVAAGATRYVTGRPCQRGHISERLVSTRSCIECERARKAEWVARNQDKVKAQIRNWSVSNPKRRADSKRKARTGFTSALFDATIKAQSNACAICTQPFGVRPANRPNADHCHATKRPRGVLCARCDTMLGKLRDDIQLIKRMADYLENPPAAAVAASLGG